MLLSSDERTFQTCRRAIRPRAGFGKPDDRTADDDRWRSHREPWHWSVCRWLDDENPTVEQITQPGLLAQDLAEFVTALRQLDTTGGPPAGRGVPLATRDAPTRAGIEDLRDVIDTDQATAAWEEALDVPKWSGAAAWVHGDLSPGNVLITPLAAQRCYRLRRRRRW